MAFKINPIEAVGNLSRQALVRAQVYIEQYSVDPREKRIMLATAAITTGTLFFSTAASADGGWAGMFNTGANQADAIKTNFGKLLGLGGLISGSVGGWNWYKKGSEGDRSDIKPKQIFGPIVAGAALGSISFILMRTGETVGISASEYGQVPN